MIEVYDITQEDTDVTQTDTTAASLQDLFVYRVPLGVSIILSPEDVLNVYLRETDDTVAQATAQVKLEIRDSTGSEKQPLVHPTQYAVFNGEFQDEDLFVKLDIPAPITIPERWYIALMGNNPSPFLDKDLSYFTLTAHRER